MLQRYYFVIHSAPKNIQLVRGGGGGGEELPEKSGVSLQRASRNHYPISAKIFNFPHSISNRTQN